MQHSIARSAAFLTALLATYPAASGQTLLSRWAIVNETQAGIGYDSNLYGSEASEVHDGLASLSQSISISRKNSLARVVLQGNIDDVRYFSEQAADFVDGAITLDLAYPNDPIDVSFWKGRVFWTRKTNINLDSGRRLQPSSYGASFSGEWLASPKLGFTGMIQSRSTDYPGTNYSSSRAFLMRIGVSHAWRPEQRLSVEYNLKQGRSQGALGTDAVEHSAGVRARGKITQKIRGEAFLGFRRGVFSGRTDFEDTRPTMEADLTWESSPKFSTHLGVTSDYRFSANGAVRSTTEIELQFRREFAHGFRGYLSGGPGFSDYNLADEGRTDRYWRLNADLEYSMTERFFLQLSANWVSNNSSALNRDFDRALVNLNAGLRY